jgi:hypothetical protein
MGRRRGGGSREPILHADAQRLLAEGEDPPRVKHTIVLALRGGRSGQQVRRVCGTTARHCQCWVPPALLPVASASTAKPVVSWWCEVHHEGRTEAAIVTLLTQQRRKGTHARPTLRRPAPVGLWSP